MSFRSALFAKSSLTSACLKTEPLRVEAAIFPDDRKLYGCLLGAIGDGSRQAAAKQGMWKGHLAALIENVYLLDSTFDQVNIGRRYLRAKPLVIDLRTTKWFNPDPPYDCPWTGCLAMFDATVRFTRFPRQAGWQHASDFRPRRRRVVVEKLIDLAEPILTKD